jgi:hypothetical protein
MTQNKQTTITAEPGKQEILITREFDGDFSIEMPRETNTGFTACITKSLHLSALSIRLSLKGYRKKDM